jgi:hypothetical protein
MVFWLRLWASRKYQQNQIEQNVLRVLCYSLARYENQIHICWLERDGSNSGASALAVACGVVGTLDGAAGAGG